MKEEVNLIGDGSSFQVREQAASLGDQGMLCPTLREAAGTVSSGRGSCVNRGVERARGGLKGKTQELGVAGAPDPQGVRVTV